MVDLLIVISIALISIAMLLIFLAVKFVRHCESSRAFECAMIEVSEARMQEVKTQGENLDRLASAVGSSHQGESYLKTSTVSTY